MPGLAAPPLRVGLIGLGRSGLHLIECCAMGGPFRVVAVFADPLVADVVSPFGARLVKHPQELLAAADVDVIWITEFAGRRSDVSIAEVLAEKHAILETPLSLTTAPLEQVFEVAAQHRRLLLVHHPRRSDQQFRQALSVSQESDIGAVRAAKFVSWGYGLAPRGAARGLGPLPSEGSDEAQITKVRLVAHALDQLVSLIADRPKCLVAVGEQNASGPSNLFGGKSLLLQITFEQGCQAEIDVRLNSPTPFQSGWLLSGERGGYAKGRRFTLTDEGEVFDSPVPEFDVSNEADQLKWLAQRIRTGASDSVEESRLRDLVALLDAARRSLGSQQVVML